MTLDSYLLPCTRINDKWIKDINNDPENFREKVGNRLQDIVIDRGFLISVLTIQEIRPLINEHTR